MIKLQRSLKRIPKEDVLALVLAAAAATHPGPGSLLKNCCGSYPLRSTVLDPRLSI
jgi:hypothetical protein